MKYIAMSRSNELLKARLSLDGGDQQLVIAYFGLSVHAASARRLLDECWKRPVRHNRRIERDALWHVLQLHEHCQEALQPTARTEILSPPIDDAVLRYEHQAAIRTVHATVPFTPVERQALHDEDLAQEQWHFPDESRIRQPDLFERWHDWLWLDKNHMTQQGSAIGPSAVLGEACLRLTQGIQEMLGPLTDRAG